MRNQISKLFLLALLLPSSALYAAYAEPLADEALPFSAVLRINNGDPVSIDAPLMPGEQDTIQLAGPYLLEITAPSDDLEQGVARLLRREGETLMPIHVLRQPWRGAGWPTLGYRICGEQLAFFPLSGEDGVPACVNQSAANQPR